MAKNIAEIEGFVKDNIEQEWEIGISTLTYPNDPVRAIEELTEAEIAVHHIELSPGRRIRFGRYVETLLELKKKHKLEFSIHVPFLYDDLAHPHPEMRRIYISEARKTIELAEVLGARWVVIHPGRLFLHESLPEEDALKPLREPREFYLENASLSINELIDYVSPRHMELCIENLPSLGRNEKEVRQLIPDSDEARFLLDFGHANIPETTSELFTLKPHYFHLHDNGGKQDKHLKLGKGNIDLIKQVERISSYPGTKRIILELYSLNDILESLDYFWKILKKIVKSK